MGATQYGFVYSAYGAVIYTTQGAGVLADYFPVEASGFTFAKREGGEARFLHRNALGSVGTLTRYDGLVIQGETYYPWGQKWNSVGTLTSEQYAAMQPRDSDTGLDPTPNRMYTSGYGRWLSPDPLGGDILNPQSLNRYAYVLNNPTNLVDPTGLCDLYNYSYTSTDENGNSVYVMHIDTGPCDTSAVRNNNPWLSPWSVGNWSELNELMTATDSFTYDPQGTQPGILQQVKDKVCSAVPEGRTTGVGGSFGGPGGGAGTLEIVTNYNTGEVSAFYSKGIYVGWNGGVEAQAFSGAIYNLGDSNSNYSGGFTTVSLSPASVGVYGSQSSGGLRGGSVNAGPVPGQRTVRTVGVSVGANTTFTPTVTGSVTDYSKPLSLGKYWTLTNPVDLLGFLERQLCK